MPQFIHKLWLNETDHDLYMTANKQSHYTLFAAAIVFGVLSFICSKLSTRPTPKFNAQTQHGVSQFFHSAVTVTGAVYAVSQRLSLFETGCSTRLFCFDKLTSLFLDIHAGYLFYDWLFYLRSEKILVPRFDYSGFHRYLLLVGYALAKVHPVSLTVTILPFYQLLAVAELAESRLDLAVAFGKPTKICLDRLKYFVILSFFRAIGALGIGFYSWFWISSRDLMHLDLPVGKRAVFNTLYCYGFVGGGFALALLYMNWFRAAEDAQKRAYASLQHAQKAETTVKEALNLHSGSAKKKKRAARA